MIPVLLSPQHPESNLDLQYITHLFPPNPYHPHSWILLPDQTLFQSQPLIDRENTIINDRKQVWNPLIGQNILDFHISSRPAAGVPSDSSDWIFLAAAACCTFIGKKHPPHQSSLTYSTRKNETGRRSKQGLGIAYSWYVSPTQV